MRWSSEWVIRLGDGTEESHTRIFTALNELWPFTGELFSPSPYELALTEQGIVPDASFIYGKWSAHIQGVFEEAYLEIPSETWMQTGGKEGNHTEHLGYILAEMQFLQRAYPGCEW